MKKLFAIVGAIGFFALLFYSPDQQNDAVQSGLVPNRMPVAGQGAFFNAIPGQNNTSTAGMPVTNPTNANLGPMPEFNPPHGQPWHRCEIPVGAPLNSAPQSTGSNMNQPVAQSGPSASPANSGVKPKLNPPHGEPWHRCDIDVGAPLDSPPRSTSTQATTNNVASNPEIITPIIPPNPLEGQVKQPVIDNQDPANTGPKPAVNPPHGQPWHRCDIKVGDPLP